LVLDGRKRNIPAYHKLIKNVQRAGGDPVLAFRWLASLCAGGESVDLDLIAAACGCIDRGGANLRDFVRVLDGREKGRFDALRFGLRLGQAVLKSVDMIPMPPGGTVAMLWDACIKMLTAQNAPQSMAAPTLVINVYGDCRVSIAMRPMWDFHGRRMTPDYALESPEHLRDRLRLLHPAARQKLNTALRKLSVAVKNAPNRQGWVDGYWPMLRTFFNGSGTRAAAESTLAVIGLNYEDVSGLRYGMRMLRKKQVTDRSIENPDPDNKTDEAESNKIPDFANMPEMPDNMNMFIENASIRIPAPPSHSLATVARVLCVSRVTILRHS